MLRQEGHYNVPVLATAVAKETRFVMEDQLDNEKEKRNGEERLLEKQMRLKKLLQSTMSELDSMLNENSIETVAGTKISLVSSYELPDDGSNGNTQRNLKMERKEEHLMNIKKHVDKEKQIVDFGRIQLQEDIQRHRALMKAAIGDVNDTLELERQVFINAIVRELEIFKLPTIKRLIPTETVDRLISDAKKIGDDCHTGTVCS